MICPHCERSLTGHDDAHCRRRLSRRFFIGMLGAAVVAPAVAKVQNVSIGTPYRQERIAGMDYYNVQWPIRSREWTYGTYVSEVSNVVIPIRARRWSA